MNNNIKTRCAWAKNDFEILYHDTEWGVPVYEDNKLFEFIILESAQAGLSWSIILKKREAYRLAYANFNPKLVANYDLDQQNILMQNSGIIRNKLKISASINNAKIFLAIQQQFNSFSNYLWSFTEGKIIQNNWIMPCQIPTSVNISDRISKDLKDKGLKFFGPVTCYAFLQAVGVINDHLTCCFRHSELLEKFKNNLKVI